MRFAWLLICALMIANAADAGAWLREKGKGFSSYSLVAAMDKAWATTTYLEYGLTAKTTVGAETGFFVDGDQYQTGYATAFMRRSLRPPDHQTKLSYELGLGAAWTPDLLLWHLKTGLSFGKPIQIGDKYGWLNIDGGVRWDLSGNGLHLTQFDTTFGMHFTDRTSAMIQVYVADIAGDVFVTFAPSALIKVGNRNIKIQIGTETDVKNPRNSAFKIGLWREF